MNTIVASLYYSLLCIREHILNKRILSRMHLYINHTLQCSTGLVASVFAPGVAVRELLASNQTAFSSLSTDFLLSQSTIFAPS